MVLAGACGGATEVPGDAPDVLADVGSSSLVVTPASGSMAGYQRLVLTLPDGRSPEEVTDVRIGPHRAIALEIVASNLTLLDQGSPTPGPANVVVQYDDGEVDTAAGAFTYAEPAVPGILTAMGIGASLGQGVQRGVPTQHGQLASPPAAVARALGVYMPLPLLVEGLLTQISPADIGPPPGCQAPDILKFLTDSATDMLQRLLHPETDEIDFTLGRVDPELVPYNVAVGNSKISDILFGPSSIGAQMLTHLVYALDSGLFDPIEHSQLELVEQTRPDLVVSVDLLGNDLIGPIVSGDVLDSDGLRPVEAVAPEITAIVDRLAAASSLVLLADLPPPSLLPVATTKRIEAVATARQDATDAGEDPDAAAADMDVAYRAAISHVDALTAAYNQALRDAAAAHDHVLIVPITSRTAELVAEGLDVDGQLLHTSSFGGLLGIDGVHFTDTGYATLAQAFVDVANQHFDLAIEPLDLISIHAADPGSPQALTAAGLPLDDCDVP